MKKFIALSICMIFLIGVTVFNCSSRNRVIVNDNPILVVNVSTDTIEYPDLARYTVFDKNHFTWDFIDSIGKFKAGDTLLIIKK